MAVPGSHDPRVTLFRPVSERLTRPLSVLIVLAWLVQMGLVLRQAYLSAPVALAADLGRYGSSAQWQGVYYRGDKIGFSVGQTLATADGLRAPGGRPAPDDAPGLVHRGAAHERGPGGQGVRAPELLVLARPRDGPDRGGRGLSTAGVFTSS